MSASLSRSRRRPPRLDRATAGAALLDPARRPQHERLEPQHRGIWEDADVIAKLKRMWADGSTASAIGDELGLSRNAVIGKSRRLGLDARAPRGNRKLDWRRVHRRVRALWDDGCPTVRIAKTLGLSEWTVRKAMRAMGLRSRGNTNSHGQGSSPLSVTDKPGPVARGKPRQPSRAAPGDARLLPNLAPVAHAAGAPFGDCIGERGGVEGHAPKCEGREGYCRGSGPCVGGGIKPGAPHKTAERSGHTVAAVPSAGTRLRLTADGLHSGYQAPPALSHAVTIDALTSFTCRWPLGGEREPATHFCGATCPALQPYCEYHAAAATNPHHISRRMASAPTTSRITDGVFSDAYRFLGGE